MKILLPPNDMNKIIDIIISLYQLTTRVIFAKKAKVLFYYPQHFNRTAQATNPFFDRLLETCDSHVISYKLIEEPDWGTDKPRNDKAIKGDALFMLILVLRKVVGLFSKKDFYKNEVVVARLLNLFTLGRLRYRRYITISGSMLHLFAALKDDCEVFDMQHGILYKQHPTFFDESEHLRPQYYQRNLHWLMWGRGYDRCFCRGDEEVLAGRTHVVGYPIAPAKVDVEEMSDKIVLFSLQFTHDYQQHELEEHKKILEETLRQLQNCGVKVLLKHHPRYNNAIPIDDLIESFPFCRITKLSMQDLLTQTMLQVTFNSTTSFEYAEYGIPSFFIDPEARLPQGDLFYSEYHYPLYKGMFISDVVSRLKLHDKAKEDATTVRAWYSEFYSDFNEQAFLKLLS